MQDPIFVHVAGCIEHTAEDKLHTFHFLLCIVATVSNLVTVFGLLFEELASFFVGFVV